MKRRRLVWIYASIASFAFFFLASFLIESWKNPTSGAFWHVAALVGSIIVAAGWIVTSENTVRNNARQHTIAVILDYDKSERRDRNWITILKYLPGADDVLGPPSVSQLPADHEIYKVIDSELDYVEFIALGILSETFDRDMAKSAFHADFITLFQTASPYVDYVRADDAEVWEAFCQVCSTWNVKPLVASPKRFTENSKPVLGHYLGIGAMIYYLLARSAKKITKDQK